MMDSVGHYARPELLSLRVHAEPARPVEWVGSKMREMSGNNGTAVKRTRLRLPARRGRAPGAQRPERRPGSPSAFLLSDLTRATRIRGGATAASGLRSAPGGVRAIERTRRAGCHGASVLACPCGLRRTRSSRPPRSTGKRVRYDQPLPPSSSSAAASPACPLSYYLKQRGIDHVVLERYRAGHAWAGAAVGQLSASSHPTGNASCPASTTAAPSAANDPLGFMGKEQIVQYMERFVDSFSPPLVEGRRSVPALRVAGRGPGIRAGKRRQETTHRRPGRLSPSAATTGRPSPGRRSASRPTSCSSTRSNTATHRRCPRGDVLVVGTGQSGCQGRRGTCTSRAGGSTFCVGGGAADGPGVTAARTWSSGSTRWGYYDLPVHEHPLKERVRAPRQTTTSPAATAGRGHRPPPARR